jgi:hypothetical protein
MLLQFGDPKGPLSYEQSDRVWVDLAHSFQFNLSLGEESITDHLPLVLARDCWRHRFVIQKFTKPLNRRCDTLEHTVRGT